MRRWRSLVVVAACSGSLASGAGESALTIAERAYRQGAYAPAEGRAIEARDDARWRHDRGAEVDALRLLGAVREARGAPGGGADLERALQLAREARDLAREAAVLSEMGCAAWRRADYAAAEELLGRALALHRRARDERGEIVALGHLGRVHYKRGEYPEAEELHHRALSLAQRRKDLRAQAVALEDLALVSRDLRAFEASRQGFDAALRLARRIPDPHLVVRLLGDAGVLEALRGMRDEAARAYDAALAEAQAAGDAARAGALVLVGRAKIDAGAVPEGVALLEEAARIHERLGDRRALAWDLAALGGAERRARRLPAAVDHYGRALALWQEMGDRRAMAWHLFEVGRTHELAGDDRKALELHRRAIEMEESIHLPYMSLTLGSAARLVARSGARDEAGQLARRAVEAATATGSPELVWSAWYDAATVARRFGAAAEAADAFDHALAAIEDLREGGGSDAARAALLEDKQQVFADAIAVLWDLGRVEEALVAAERARARAFVDLLHGHATGHPLAPPPTLEAIRAEARRRGTVVLEYFLAADRAYVWVVTPAGDVHGRVLSAGRDQLQRAVDELRGNLAADLPVRGEAAVALPRAAPSAQPGRDLFRLLVEPVASLLPKDDALVTVVPHGCLFLVSFAALQDGTGRYLVEDHPLAYAPAIGALGELPAGGRRGARRMLIVGNPSMPAVPWFGRPLPALPGAEAEVRSLAGNPAAGAVTVLLGAEAREERVRCLAEESRVLHLATHGLLRDDAPLESMLALAPGSGAPEDDGLWTAREVLASRLPLDMVALSACSTGLGKITGDGVVGLSRAFLGAGTGSVVVSLWRVADVVSRHQMEDFYQALARPGVSRAAALRQAQLRTIERLRRGEIRTPSGTPVPEHPLYWAPFVLVGDASELP